MKFSAVYNWSFKECPSILTIEPEPWIMIFVVALSRKQVEGILASNASINSEMYKWFMKDVANLIEKKRAEEEIFDLSWTIHKFIEAMSEETL